MAHDDDRAMTGMDQRVGDDLTLVEPLSARAGTAARQPGSMVDHYQVMRLLDRGAMGEVYVARDVQLGRKVALKIVRAELLGSDKALSQFMFEARSIAKFSHPHIVTIYGVGEHQGCPYLALELVEGENLRDRLREHGERTALGLRESLRIALAIAEALTEAHARSILHRDLKPANVVIARDGRPRVVDFGLARRVGGESPDSVRSQGPASVPGGELSWGGGTPAYMAPEQWAEEECSSATDMWALGVIVFELCSGRRPFEDDDLAGLCADVCGGPAAPRLDEMTAAPRALADLVHACLERNPVRRPSAADAAAALRSMLAGEARSLEDSESPFRGLLPFTEKHAPLFFGREAEVASFVERARLHAVLPVVGPSGAGKSSFVRAGVIPRLCEQGPWIVLSLRPGPRPFRTLVARLARVESESEATLTSDPAGHDGPSGEAAALRASARAAELLAEKPRRLAMELRALAAKRNASVLLFVDQLEELFTLVDDQEVRRSFMRAICSAADDADDPVRVVFTVRDDFLGRLATDAEVRDALGHVTVVQSLEPDALRQILLGPLRSLDYRFEDPEMVDAMVDAVTGSPAGLPLLQFAAQRLWELRDERQKLLLRSVYDRMGGVEGALAKHADGVLDGLSPDEIDLARALLLRLVTPERTRRVLPRSDVLDGLGDRAGALVARLTAARLITARKTGEHGRDDADLELAHESLIQSWPTLARWIDESADEGALLSELAAAAELWRRRGERPEELWQGTALDEAGVTIARATRTVPPEVRRFVEQGADRQRRRLRRRRNAVVASMVVSAAIALASVSVALHVSDKEREASEQRRLAEQREAQVQERRAEALREAARGAFERGEMLEARAKLRMALELEDTPAARVLWWQLENTPLVWTKKLAGIAYTALISPDGKSVAAGCQDGVVYLLDVTTGGARLLRGHSGQVVQIAWSPDSRRLASGSSSGEIRLWDRDTAHTLRQFEGHTTRIHGLSFSPDGNALASLAGDHSLRWWTIADGTSRVLDDSVPTTRWSGLAISPDGKSLASGDEQGVVRVHDVVRGTHTRLVAHPEEVLALAYSPDGDALATGSWDGRVRIWDARSLRQKRELAHAHPVASIAFASEGGVLAVGQHDGTVRLWSAGERPLADIEAGPQPIGVSVGSGGKVLVTAGSDNTVRLWSIARARDWPPRAEGHSYGEVTSLSFLPRGDQIVTAGYDGRAHLWDIASGRQLRVLASGLNTNLIPEVALSSDGRLLAFPTQASLQLLELATNKSRAIGDGTAEALLFFHDDELLAAASLNDVRIWEVSSARERAPLLGHQGRVQMIRKSAQGLVASSSADRTVRIWDPATGAELARLAHGSAVRGIAFSPDGRHIGSGEADGSVRLWDWQSRTDRVLGHHAGRVHGLAFHPDGRRIATTSADGTVGVWELDGGVRLLRGHRNEVNAVAVSPDGRLLASASDDTTVRLWELDSGRPYWRALFVPPFILTHRGWMSTDGRPADKPVGRWAADLDKRGVIASTAGADLLCVRTNDERLVLWDREADALLADHVLEGVEQIAVWSGGCAARSRRAAWFLDAAGGLRELASDPVVSAIEIIDGALAVASSRRVSLLDAAGATTREYPVAGEVTALTRAILPTTGKPALLLGYRDGNIEVLAEGDQAASSISFAAVRPNPPVRMIPGPLSTLIVGYANGLFGLWDLRDGSLLAYAGLHGAVTNIMLDGARLYIASELGSHLAWDLEPLFRDYCALLEEVGDRVPVVWQAGQAVARPPERPARCDPARSY